MKRLASWGYTGKQLSTIKFLWYVCMCVFLKKRLGQTTIANSSLINTTTCYSVTVVQKIFTLFLFLQNCSKFASVLFLPRFTYLIFTQFHSFQGHWCHQLFLGNFQTTCMSQDIIFQYEGDEKSPLLAERCLQRK